MLWCRFCCFSFSKYDDFDEWLKWDTSLRQRARTFVISGIAIACSTGSCRVLLKQDNRTYPAKPIARTMLLPLSVVTAETASLESFQFSAIFL